MFKELPAKNKGGRAEGRGGGRGGKEAITTGRTEEKSESSGLSYKNDDETKHQREKTKDGRWKALILFENNSFCCE